MAHEFLTGPAAPVVGIDIARFSRIKTVEMAHTLDVFRLSILFLEDKPFKTAQPAVALWLPEVTSSQPRAVTSFVWGRASEEGAYDFCLARIIDWTRPHSPDILPQLVVTEKGVVVENSDLYEMCALKGIADAYSHRELALPRLITAGFKIPIEVIARRILAGS